MDKEKTWYVYMHTNKINNKKYIGITGQDRYWDRWRSDGSGYKTQVFGRAIEKYGWDNFKHEIEYSRKVGRWSGKWRVLREESENRITRATACLTL